MKITRLGGITSVNDSRASYDKIEGIFQANMSLSVGNVVGHLQTTTTNVTGASITDTPLVNVVGAATASDHLAVGIFEGGGNVSGAATTTAGMSGNHANTGDVVYVTIYGPATTLVEGGTNDANPGSVLYPSTGTTGNLDSIGTTLGTAITPQFVHLDAANTSATFTTAKVFVKCM